MFKFSPSPTPELYLFSSTAGPEQIGLILTIIMSSQGHGHLRQRSVGSGYSRAAGSSPIVASAMLPPSARRTAGALATPPGSPIGIRNGFSSGGKAVCGNDFSSNCSDLTEN